MIISIEWMENTELNSLSVEHTAHIEYVQSKIGLNHLIEFRKIELLNWFAALAGWSVEWPTQ